MGRKTYTSPAAWDELRMDYVSGNGTVRSLALKHQINPGTAEQRAKRERWTTQRAEYLTRKKELPLLPVINPPHGQLPPFASPDRASFAGLNERFHGLAEPILERIEEGLEEMGLPQTPGERLALANSVRTLAQTAREILGIPLVKAIKRRERSAALSPIPEPELAGKVMPADPPDSTAVTDPNYPASLSGQGVLQ